MSFLKKLVFGLMFWFFLGSVNLFAQVHDHQGHHQMQVTSPFEAKKETKALHCLLRLHSVKNFCPHSNFGKGRGSPASIASDCKGKTSGTVPAASSGFCFDDLMINAILSNKNWSKSLFVQDPSFVDYTPLDVLSPPPRPI